LTDEGKAYNSKKFINIVWNVTLVGVGMCFITGLFGYLAFRGDTKSDILLNFNGTLGAIFKIIIVIHLLFYIPGDFIIMRYSLCKLFDTNVLELDNMYYVPLTLFLLILSGVFSYGVLYYFGSNNGLILVINIAGGIGSSVNTFLIPGLIGLIEFQSDFHLFNEAIVVTVAGCIVPLLVIASACITYA
jgi:uncharacterized membrane protein (DUF373 family)